MGAQQRQQPCQCPCAALLRLNKCTLEATTTTHLLLGDGFAAAPDAEPVLPAVEGRGEAGGRGRLPPAGCSSALSAAAGMSPDYRQGCRQVTGRTAESAQPHVTSSVGLVGGCGRCARSVHTESCTQHTTVRVSALILVPVLAAP
jgi:hypothetical protein